MQSPIRARRCLHAHTALPATQTTTHLWILCLQSRKGQAGIAPNDVTMCANQHNGCIRASNRHIHEVAMDVRQIHTSSQTIHNYVNGPIRE